MDSHSEPPSSEITTNDTSASESTPLIAAGHGSPRASPFGTFGADTEANGNSERQQQSANGRNQPQPPRSFWELLYNLLVRFICKCRWEGLCAAAVAAVLLLIWWQHEKLISSVASMIANCLTIKVESATFGSATATGFPVQLKCRVTPQYTSPLVATMASWIGTITISPRKLHISHSNSGVTLATIGTSRMAPLLLQTSDGTTTSFNASVVVKPTSHGFVALQELLDYTVNDVNTVYPIDIEIPLQFAGSANFHIGNASVGTHNVAGEKTVSVSVNGWSDAVNFVHSELLSVAEPQNGTMLQLRLNVSADFGSEFPLSLPFSARFPVLHWTAYAAGCPNSGNSFVPIATVATPRVAFDSRVAQFAATVGVSVPELPKAFAAPCGDSDSFLERVAHAIIAEKPEELASFFFLAGSAQQAAGIPPWLSVGLSRLWIRIPVELLNVSAVAWENPVSNVSLSQFRVAVPQTEELQIAETTHPDELSVDISAGFRLDIPGSEKIAARCLISAIRGDIRVSFRGSPVAEIGLPAWTEVNMPILPIEGQTRMSLAAIRVSLFNGWAINKLLRQFFAEQAATLDFCGVLDIRLVTALGQTELRGLRFCNSQEISGNFTTNELFSDSAFNVSEIAVAEARNDSLQLSARTILSVSSEFEAEIPEFLAAVHYEGCQISEISVSPFVVQAGKADLRPFVTLRPVTDPDEPFRAVEKLQEFLGKFVSEKELNITVCGTIDSLPGLPQLSAVLKEICVPITIPELNFGDNDESSGDTNKETGDVNGQNGYDSNIISHMLPIAETLSNGNSPTKPECQRHGIFLRGSTMHLMTSDVDFIAYNPITNTEIRAIIISASANYEGKELGYISRSSELSLPPGVHETPRLPIAYSSGVGGDVLRKALNGELLITALAWIKIEIGDWTAVIVYEGDGVCAKIRLV